jgi:hypothetical protein
MGVMRVDPKSGCVWLENGGRPTSQLIFYGEWRLTEFNGRPAIYRDNTLQASAGDFVKFTGAGTATDGVAGCPVSGVDVFHVTKRLR